MSRSFVHWTRRWSGVLLACVAAILLTVAGKLLFSCPISQDEHPLENCPIEAEGKSDETPTGRSRREAEERRAALAPDEIDAEVPGEDGVGLD